MVKRLANPLTRTLALVAVATALSACEVRRDGTEGDPEPDPTAEATGADTAEPTATPTPTETVSIMREDIAPDREVEEEPAEPFAVTIPFPDGPELTAAGERLLVSALSSDAMDEDWPIVLGGHTDSTGNDQANLRSSRARAEAVAAWLVEYGVDDARIEVIAFGEQNPVAPNARPDGTPNEAGRRQNRRVELSISAPQPRPRPSATRTAGTTNRPE